MVKKIDILGTVVPDSDKWVYDLFDLPSTSPEDVISELNNSNGDDIEVEISSGGGSVFDGSRIYSALKDSSNNVTVKVTGIAASIASVIAMAGSEVLISPTAQIMIHNVSSIAEGDYKDLKHQSDVIKNYNKSIANAYINKTGKSQDELLSMMNKETWLTADQAKEHGFADKIMFEDEQKTNLNLVASGGETIIPQPIIDKIKENKVNDKLMEFGVTNIEQENDEQHEQVDDEDIDVSHTNDDDEEIREEVCDPNDTKEECDKKVEEYKKEQEQEETEDSTKKQQAQAKLNLLKLK